LPNALIVLNVSACYRRGLARSRTKQPPSSILNRGIKAEVLPRSSLRRLPVNEPAARPHPLTALAR
jgi:hypothetical protein